MLNHLFNPSIPRWFFAFVPYKISEGLFEILLPLFIIQVAAGDVTDVGKIKSLNTLAAVIAFTFWGNLSDKCKSRRLFLCLGIIGFCLFTLLIGSEHSVEQVLKYSTCGAFLMAAVAPISTALVVESVPEKRLSHFFSRFYLLCSWSFVASTIVGAIWLAWCSRFWNSISGMRSLLMLVGVMASLSGILCLLWVREPKRVQSHRHLPFFVLERLSIAIVERLIWLYSSRNIYFFLRPKSILKWQSQLNTSINLYYLFSALLFLSLAIVYIPFPVFVQEKLGATNSILFLIVLGKAVVETVLYVPFSRLVQSKNKIKLQAVATGTRVAIFLTLALLAINKATWMSLLIVAILHILTGITWTVINLSSTVSVAVLANKGQEGMAIGIYNSVIGIATILGSFVSGYLAMNFGYTACFMTGAILIAISAACLWWLGVEISMPRLANSVGKVEQIL